MRLIQGLLPLKPRLLSPHPTPNISLLFLSNGEIRFPHYRFPDFWGLRALDNCWVARLAGGGGEALRDQQESAAISFGSGPTEPKPRQRSQLNGGTVTQAL
jgi:hypothetical protein